MLPTSVLDRHQREPFFCSCRNKRYLFSATATNVQFAQRISHKCNSTFGQWIEGHPAISSVGASPYPAPANTEIYNNTDNKAPPSRGFLHLRSEKIIASVAALGKCVDNNTRTNSLENRQKEALTRCRYQLPKKPSQRLTHPGAAPLIRRVPRQSCRFWTIQSP